MCDVCCIHCHQASNKGTIFQCMRIQLVWTSYMGRLDNEDTAHHRPIYTAEKNTLKNHRCFELSFTLLEKPTSKNISV